VSLRLVVRLLAGGEAALVHAVVDFVRPLVDLIDLCPQGRRVEVECGGGGEGVELVVEHAQNLTALVVHDGVALGVPQDGYRVLALRVAGVRQVVEVAHELNTMHSVRCTAGGGEAATAVHTGHVVGHTWINELPPTM
jgi:hypothetical protein